MRMHKYAYSEREYSSCVMKWGSKNLPKTETCNDLHIEMGLCGDGVFIILY